MKFDLSLILIKGRWWKVALIAGAALALGFFFSHWWNSLPIDRYYELRGKVISVDKLAHEITVDHEEIKGYMGRMVMPYRVREDDDYILGIVYPGDEVAATLVVGEKSSWLEHVTVTKEGGRTVVADNRNLQRLPQPGDEVPDFTLVNQDGKRINLKNYRGKFLLVTFIYTRCPLPDYCPRMSNNFFEINNFLSTNPAMYARTHLLSVSFDTEYDTPAVLREYGVDYTGTYHRGNFEHWEFASGTAEEVKNMAEAFGLRYTPDKGQIIHSLRTALIAQDGKLLKLYTGNDWKPSDIIGDLLKQDIK